MMITSGSPASSRAMKCSNSLSFLGLISIMGTGTAAKPLSFK